MHKCKVKYIYLRCGSRPPAPNFEARCAMLAKFRSPPPSPAQILDPHLLHSSISSSGSRRGGKGAMPPPPCLVKIGQTKMAAKCGGLYLMFLAPPPPLLSEVSGSATDIRYQIYSTCDTYFDHIFSMSR